MKTAIIFPGQGSQVTGMGRAVAESDGDVMDLWKYAETLCGMPLRGIYWESDDQAMMADTRALQPALTVATLTAYKAALPRLLRAGYEPACMAGHSLGEYAALIAAGALRADDGLRLVTLRGALMADADPQGVGAMAAVVRVPLPDLEQAVEAARREIGDPNEVLVAANRNTPTQTVVSGTKAALEVLAPRIRALRGRMVPLAVGGAFHSPMMDGASKALAGRIAKAAWSTPSCPVYPNLSGRAVADRDALRTALTGQMTHPVLWVDTIRNMWADGVAAFAEPGPKGVLGRMVRPNLEGVADPAALERLPILGVDGPDALQA